MKVMLANQQQAIEAIRRERENLEWITRSMGNLRKKYGDRFVAVKDRKIVDSDSDFEALFERIRKLPDSEFVTIEFVSALELIWML